MTRVTRQCGIFKRHQISVLILVDLGLGESPKGTGAKPKPKTNRDVCVGVTFFWNEGSRHFFSRSYDCEGRAEALVRNGTNGTRNVDRMDLRGTAMVPLPWGRG